MKKLSTLIFLLAMVGCTTLGNNCRYSIQSFISSHPLRLWEDVTEQAMIRSNDPKLHFFQKNAKSDSVDFLDRDIFLKDINANYKRDSLNYSNLYIVEFNSSGEVNIMEKVLFAKCKDTYKIVKFKKNDARWINMKASEKDSKIIDQILIDFNNNPDGKMYWGNHIGDILAITEIKENLVFKVDMYPGLNKKQYELITKLINQ